MADEESERPPSPRRSALEVRREHRVLQEVSEALVREIVLVPQGTALERRHEYLDLHDPARADFRAEGVEVVRPGQQLVARSEVPAEAWEALRAACDRVARRRTLPRAS